MRGWNPRRCRTNTIYIVPTLSSIVMDVSFQGELLYNFFNCVGIIKGDNVHWKGLNYTIFRYRKYNTELDPLLNRTRVPEVQIFHTGKKSSSNFSLCGNIHPFFCTIIVDFGVTFGHFTSFDIMAKYPSYMWVLLML